MNLHLLITAAGFFLLISLAVWGSTLVPLVLGLGVAIFLYAIVPNRPIPKREPIALMVTFALSFAFMLFIISDKLTYDRSGKFFGMLAVAGVFALACTAMLAAVYYLGSALANIKPDKRMLAHFLAPAVMLLPQIFTEIGNSYRKRCLLALLVFGACFGLIATLKASMR